MFAALQQFFACFTVTCGKAPSHCCTLSCMQVKATTKFSKIFDAYAGKKGIEAANIKFLYDGQRIRDHQTPAELGIEVGDAQLASRNGS